MLPKPRDRSTPSNVVVGRGLEWLESLIRLRARIEYAPHGDSAHGRRRQVGHAEGDVLAGNTHEVAAELRGRRRRVKALRVAGHLEAIENTSNGHMRPPQRHPGASASGTRSLNPAFAHDGATRGCAFTTPTTRYPPIMREGGPLAEFAGGRLTE